MVLEALSSEVREGLPLELLYADDLGLMAETEELLRDRILCWKECLECKGLKVNVSKSKVMVSGTNLGSLEKTGKWPCSVCGREWVGIPFGAQVAAAGYTKDVLIPLSL